MPSSPLHYSKKSDIKLLVDQQYVIVSSEKGASKHIMGATVKPACGHSKDSKRAGAGNFFRELTNSLYDKP